MGLLRECFCSKFQSRKAEERIDCTPRRESKNGYEQTIAKHYVSAAEQVIVQVFGSNELCPAAAVAEEYTRWVITSAWLTVIHLLSCDKSLLSLVCPGLKYFCSDKVQKEIVKISTCRTKLNFCPHATKALSRGDNLCQEGDYPLGRGKGSGGAESREKFREVEV